MTRYVEIEYPRGSLDGTTTVQIGLMDVRAADDIRISYDFERDGWKVEQEHIITDRGHYWGTGEWSEVAFVEAWGHETKI